MTRLRYELPTDKARTLSIAGAADRRQVSLTLSQMRRSLATR